MFSLLLVWLIIFLIIYYLNKEDKNEGEEKFIRSNLSRSKRDYLEKNYDNKISKGDRLFVFKKFNNTCFKCGSKKNLTIDHHMPLSLGYKLDKNNAVVLCRNCNKKKSNLMPEKFYTAEELEELERNYKINTDYKLRKVRKSEMEMAISKLAFLNKGRSYVSFNYLGKKVEGRALGLIEEKKKAYNRKKMIYLEVEDRDGVDLYNFDNITELYIKGE